MKIFVIKPTYLSTSGIYVGVSDLFLLEQLYSHKTILIDIQEALHSSSKNCESLNYSTTNVGQCALSQRKECQKTLTAGM